MIAPAAHGGNLRGPAAGTGAPRGRKSPCLRSAGKGPGSPVERGSELVAEARQGGATVLEVADRTVAGVAVVEGRERFVADVADLQVQRQALQRAAVGEAVVHLRVLHRFAGDADGLVVGAEAAGLAAEIGARAAAVA